MTDTIGVRTVLTNHRFTPSGIHMQLPVRLCASAILGAGLLTACGSSSSSTSSQSSPSSSATAVATSSPTTAGGNPALAVALTAAELPSGSGGMTQFSDGLLGSTPNTDARVFASADNNTRVEVDVAVDTSAGAAATDFAAYNDSAAKQVSTRTSTSAPTIGSQASEYAGTTASNHVVAIAFVQGSVICVVTYVSKNAIDAAGAEGIATAQAQKIAAAGL